jgi:uncharacterized protein YndB with AHSA1/START domain
MSTIVQERIIAASPQRVFNALTQPGEIGHWWTNDLNVTPEVGSLAEFRFGEWGEFVLRFEVAELDRNKKVHWIFRFGPPQWAGTDITWHLTPVWDGTRLLFTHEGFGQVDEAYISGVRGNWTYFLDSLKSYLETGKGTPGSPPYR